MTIIVYDTETNGLPLYREPSNHPGQPHLVQLALVHYDADGSETAARSVIIRPDGWTISPEMTAIHGISQERAMADGIPESHAVALWFLAQGKTSLRVAYNEPFDRRIMRIAALRAGFIREYIDLMEARPSYDPMPKARPLVKCPPTGKQMAAGFASYKAPKLSESYRHFFGEDLDGAHDALVDARACGRVFWHLKTLEAVA